MLRWAWRTRMARYERAGLETRRARRKVRLRGVDVGKRVRSRSVAQKSRMATRGQVSVYSDPESVGHTVSEMLLPLVAMGSRCCTVAPMRQSLEEECPVRKRVPEVLLDRSQSDRRRRHRPREFESTRTLSPRLCPSKAQSQSISRRDSHLDASREVCSSQSRLDGVGESSSTLVALVKRRDGASDGSRKPLCRSELLGEDEGGESTLEGTTAEVPIVDGILASDGEESFVVGWVLEVDLDGRRYLEHRVAESLESLGTRRVSDGLVSDRIDVLGSRTHTRPREVSAPR